MTTPHAESMTEAPGRLTGRPAVRDLLPLRRQLRLWRWHRSDIEAEIRSHLAEVTGELVAQGLGEAAAREQALDRLGDLGELGKELQQIHRGWIGGVTVKRRMAVVLLVGAAVLLLAAGVFYAATSGRAFSLTQVPLRAEEMLVAPMGGTGPAGPMGGSGGGGLGTSALVPVEDDSGATGAKYEVKVPYPHSLRVSAIRYERGKLANQSAQGDMWPSLPAGAYQLRLIVREARGMVMFDVQRVATDRAARGGASGLWVHADWWSAGAFLRPRELREGLPVPVYAFVQQPDRGLPLDPKLSVAEIIRRYEVVTLCQIEVRGPQPAAGR